MRICVIGGAGYVGSALVPHLLSKGHEVTVMDLWWFGDRLQSHPNLCKTMGDIRKKEDLRRCFERQDAVIHLACVSNDPSFEMNPQLGKSINFDCFQDCLTILQEKHVGRFIYASSSSVYGVSALENVTEDSPKNPLTSYSDCKLKCEEMLEKFGMGGVWTVVRPATVCGYAPRLRLDVVINILTMAALTKKKITVLGGDQKRPNINIKDMVLAYDTILEAPEKEIDQQIYNVGFENKTIYQLANLVKLTLMDGSIEVVTEPTNDNRSYHVNSDKISHIFKPKFDIGEAIHSLSEAYDMSLFRVDDVRNYNNKQMKALGL